MCVNYGCLLFSPTLYIASLYAAVFYRIVSRELVVCLTAIFVIAV